MNIYKYIEGLYSVQTQLNLSKLRKTSSSMYEIIQENFEDKKLGPYGQTVLQTKLYTKYNFLLYPLPGIHELYFEISKVFHECLKLHPEIPHEKYFIQCWLNYFNKGEFIDWHGHSSVDFNNWHGFLCLDTEPNSYTSYKWPFDSSRKNLIIDVPSKDGMIVMGRTNGDMHRSSEWTHDDHPRITIAFDIVPGRFISEWHCKDYAEPKYLNAMKAEPHYINHWIPI